MADDARDRGEDLEPFRERLHVLARLQLDSRLQGKLDLSGVVQQTLLEAHQGQPQVQGQTGDMFRWLRRILLRNLVDEVRKLRRVKHGAVHEQSLEAALDESAARLEASLVDDGSSPSEQAERNEHAARLAAALAELPDEQREAVILHHLEGHTLAEVAQRMGKSKDAVAGLVQRGIRKLRDLLKESD